MKNEETAVVVQPTNTNTKDFTSKFGNKFIFQKCALSTWLDLQDRSEASGRRLRTVMYPAVLETIVVSPTMKVDDFMKDGYGGYAELEEVLTEAIRFQQG